MRDHEGDDRKAPQADARHECRRRPGRVRDARRRIGLKDGDELGPSRWLEVDQDRIDAFAAATDDSQWIHTNRLRAADGPYGVTIAHGFLTLSLLPGFWFELTAGDGHPVTINYGVDRVRFPAPVPVGSRVRASFRVEEVVPVDGGEQARITATIEREGHDKPVCVAELVFRFLSAG